jgi:hypothetical protein
MKLSKAERKFLGRILAKARAAKAAKARGKRKKR